MVLLIVFATMLMLSAVGFNFVALDSFSAPHPTCLIPSKFFKFCRYCLEYVYYFDEEVVLLGMVESLPPRTN